MEDDIVNLNSFSNVRVENTINLDEFSMPRNSTAPAIIDDNLGIQRRPRQHEMGSSEPLPSQGTACRRIKLEINHSVRSYMETDTVELGKGMKRGFLPWKVSHPLMFKAIAYLALMVSLLLMLRAIWHFARFTASIIL